MPQSWVRHKDHDFLGGSPPPGAAEEVAGTVNEALCPQLPSLPPPTLL